jgi:hypothetical protein
MAYKGYLFKAVDKDNRYSLLDFFETKMNSMKKWKWLEYKDKWYF